MAYDLAPSGPHLSPLLAHCSTHTSSPLAAPLSQTMFPLGPLYLLFLFPNHGIDKSLDTESGGERQSCWFFLMAYIYGSCLLLVMKCRDIEDAKLTVSKNRYNLFIL